ncbi:mybL, partial [Symbiodinium microadriaticum]
GDGQCREKWVNVLDPLLLRNRFSPEEDAILLREVAKYITPSVSGADPSEPVNSGAVDGYTAPRAVNWNLIAAQLGNLRTDCQVARRWRELSGDHMAAKYKETSRKRRAIAPADYNRPGGGKCKSRQRGVDVLDDREFEPTVLVTAAQELLEVRQEEQSAEDEGTSTVPIAEL